MTCNVVKGAQMLVIGGTFPLTQNCDAYLQFGTHNLALGGKGGADDDASWELFDPDLTAYAVPAAITSAVGGGPTGGATRTAPAAGFDNPDLDVLMTKRASVAARTPTRAVPSSSATGSSTGSSSSSSSSGPSTGAIVGIAVGGAVGLAALAAGLCILVRRCRRRRGGGAGEGYAAPGRGSKSSAGGSSGYPVYGPGSPWDPRYAGAVGGPRSPSSSYRSPLSPFARRPSNLNVQQGPAELAAPLEGNEFEMDEGGGGGGGGGMVPRPLRLSSRTTTSSGGVGGGADGMALGQPKFDDQGRPWYPQVSMVDGMMHSPTSHAPHGGYSPVTPGSPPQELGTGRNASVAGWSEGDSSTSRGTSMRRGTSGSGQDMRRHDTYYHA